MRIRTNDDYRRALDRLKQLQPGGDDRQRRELEAAVTAYAQEHDNSKARRGRPPTQESAATPALPED
jgi:hypothetical protein